MLCIYSLDKQVMIQKGTELIFEKNRGIYVEGWHLFVVFDVTVIYSLSYILFVIKIINLLQSRK